MKLATLGLVALLAACDVTPAPVQPEPAGADCPRACDNLRALRCLDRMTTPNGAPCEAWLCESSVGPKRATCIAYAPTCADMEACR